MNTEDFAARFNPKVAEAIAQATATAGFPQLLGIRVVDVQPGSIICSMTIEPKHQSGVGAVHGGAVAALVDHTLSLAVYPLVEVGRWVATLELKLNYIGAVTKGEVRAMGRVESLRGHIAVVHVDVENDGTLVAVGQGTLYVRDKLGKK